HATRAKRLLQSLAEDYVVESLIRIIRQTLIDIALINGNTAGNGALNLRAGDFDAARIHTLVLSQPLEQFAITATEVQDFCVRLNDFANDPVVAATQKVADQRGRLRHRSNHCTFSYVLAKKPRMRPVCSATSTRKASWP